MKLIVGKHGKHNPMQLYNCKYFYDSTITRVMNFVLPSLIWENLYRRAIPSNVGVMALTATATATESTLPAVVECLAMKNRLLVGLSPQCRNIKILLLSLSRVT